MTDTDRAASYFNNCATEDFDPATLLLRNVLLKRNTDLAALRDRFEVMVQELDGDIEAALEEIRKDVHIYGTVISPSLWGKGDSIDPKADNIVLGIRFLDGTKVQRAVVMKYVPTWSKALDDVITFREVATGGSVQVTFTGGTNKYVAAEKKVYLPDVRSDNSIGRRKVLHEFGHVLGLSHEHFNPGFEIEWKTDQVIADAINAKYKPGKLWTASMVRRNITATPKAKTCPAGGDFDDKSIMVYAIDESWNNSGVKVGEIVIVGE